MRRMKVGQRFTFYTDDGHGWVAVPVEFLFQLAILHKISAYSYVKGQTAYLEEDCDAGVFLEAYREVYGAPQIQTKHTNGRSPIRSYARATGNNLQFAFDKARGLR